MALEKGPRQRNDFVAADGPELLLDGDCVGAAEVTNKTRLPSAHLCDVSAPRRVMSLSLRSIQSSSLLGHENPELPVHRPSRSEDPCHKRTDLRLGVLVDVRVG